MSAPETKGRSSFSEEKEAKRLLLFGRGGESSSETKSQKFFGSFFQKRTPF
jgi:hypothetical protein